MKILILIFLILINKPLSLKSEDLECSTFDKNNYQKILNKQKNGLYQNPFHKERCFLLSFSKDIDVEKYIGHYNEEIIQHSLLYLDMGNFIVAHIKGANKDDTYFNVFNFIMDSRSSRALKYSSSLYPNLKNYYPEIYFLHEIYHLHEIDFEINEKYYEIYEIYADIFSVLVISDLYDLTLNEKDSLMEQIFHLRINALDVNFYNSNELQELYKEEIKKLIYLDYNFNNFSDYIHKIKKNSKTLNNIKEKL